MIQQAQHATVRRSHAVTLVGAPPGTAELLSLARPGGAILGRYLDGDGRRREVIARRGLAASVLVLDRDAGTLTDHRLVAHLPPDEPLANALVVCRQYLCDPRRRRRCRLLTYEDVTVVPLAAEQQQLISAARAIGETLLDRRRASHRIELVERCPTLAELRWRRRAAGGDDGGWESVSVRDVIAAIERYEPVRALTAAALARHQEDRDVSASRLRAELERVHCSPIVLNLGLRRAVLAAMRTQGLSMSEIAIRCGRAKSDARGNKSGETSWLSRRVGLSPEGARGVPTPWIHSEVLALIARRGLGVSPREVEVS